MVIVEIFYLCRVNLKIKGNFFHGKVNIVHDFISFNMNISPTKLIYTANAQRSSSSRSWSGSTAFIHKFLNSLIKNHRYQHKD